MNKKSSAWIQLIVSSVIFMILLIVLIAGISGGEFGISPFGSDNSKFTTGSGKIEATDGELKELNVDWLDGTVQIIKVDDSAFISVEETSSHKLSENNRVHYYYHNGILDIQYKSSRHFTLFSKRNYDKNLVIKIPEHLYDSEALAVSVDSVSSQTTIEDLEINTLETDSVSGEVNFAGSASEIKCDTVSGNLFLNSYTTPKKITTDSVSADVNIQLPQDSEFSTKYDSVSGHLNLNGFDDTKTNSDKALYSFNSVSGNVNISTLSD